MTKRNETDQECFWRRAEEIAAERLQDDADIERAVEGGAPPSLRRWVASYLADARTRRRSCTCDIDHDNPPLVHFGGQQ